MKQLLRPQILIVGTAVLAVLGWTTASAATGSFGDRHTSSVHSSLSVQATESPEATPAHEPDAQTPAPEPSPEPVESPEAAPVQNEPAEPAETETETESQSQNNDEHPTPPPPPVASPAPTSSSQTFQLVGGTVTFTCTGNVISLDSAVPAAGFSVETESEDGGQQIRVRFESDTHRSEIQAGCSGGQVVASEMREESD